MAPPASDGFSDFQANVGKATSTMDLMGACFFLFVALCVFGYGAYTFYKTRGSAASEEDKKRGKMWLLWSSVGVGVAFLSLVWSAWWRQQVYQNRGFAEAAGTLSEINMVSNLLRPPVQSSNGPNFKM